MADTVPARVLNAPFQERRTWLLGVQELNGWEIKAYAITASGADLSDGVLEAALGFVTSELQEKRLEEQQLANDLAPEEKLGFLILHEGAEAVWLLVDLWIGDILHHHLYRAPLDQPREFEKAWQDHSAACVWELEVIHHERNAWVEHVLRHPETPRYDQYLAASLQIVKAD